MRGPFPVPEETIIDPETGLALNVPAAYQEWPGWWNDEPEKYGRLQARRKELGIVVDDFPDGIERMTPDRQYVPMEEEDDDD